jgi:hypothetical protein
MMSDLRIPSETFKTLYCEFHIGTNSEVADVRIYALVLRLLYGAVSVTLDINGRLRC